MLQYYTPFPYLVPVVPNSPAPNRHYSAPKRNLLHPSSAQFPPSHASTFCSLQAQNVKLCPRSIVATKSAATASSLQCAWRAAFVASKTSHGPAPTKLPKRLLFVPFLHQMPILRLASTGIDMLPLAFRTSNLFFTNWSPISSCRRTLPSDLGTCSQHSQQQDPRPSPTSFLQLATLTSCHFYPRITFAHRSMCAITALSSHIFPTAPKAPLH